MERKRIVCGTDFSIHAAEAGNVAAILATRLDQTLVLVHVLEKHAVAENARLRQSLRTELETKLQLEAQRLRDRGALVRTELAEGSPYLKLVETSQRETTRLLVVSSLGQIAFSRFLVGSVAERTAEHAAVPTLVVHGSSGFEAWARGERALRILVAYDFTNTGQASLQWLKILLAVAPCEIKITHVALPPREERRLEPPAAGQAAAAGATPEKLLELDLREKVTSVLGDQKVELEVLPSWSRPDLPILDKAGEFHADLIVIGSHQRPGLQNFWLGSVSRSVLRQAPMSVAVVPPQSLNSV